MTRTLLLEVLEEGLPVELLLLGHLLEHVEDARHHALKTAEVDVRALVEFVEHLVPVLLHLSSACNSHECGSERRGERQKMFHSHFPVVAAKEWWRNV